MLFGCELNAARVNRSFSSRLLPFTLLLKHIPTTSSIQTLTLPAFLLNGSCFRPSLRRKHPSFLLTSPETITGQVDPFPGAVYTSPTRGNIFARYASSTNVCDPIASFTVSLWLRFVYFTHALFHKRPTHCDKVMPSIYGNFSILHEWNVNVYKMQIVGKESLSKLRARKVP